MDVFELRDHLIGDYRAYVESFINIRDERLRSHAEAALHDGDLWPDPLIQLNPAFQPGAWIDDLVRDNHLAWDRAA